MSLPSIVTGFTLDDHVHRYALTGLPGPARGLNLFDFTPANQAELRFYIEHGPYPWWTSPDLKVRFFRPLASALLRFDHVVFQDNAALAHAHSVLWGLAFVWVAWLVLRRLLSLPVAGLALIIFAVSESHWMPVAWLANRNAVIAGVFGLLGFLAHLRWREDGQPRTMALLSLAAFAAALCAAEAALGFLVLPVAWELTRPGSLRARAAGVVPAAIALAAYAVVYKTGGYGARGSGIYIDPATAPLAYLREAPVRLVVLVGNLLANAPADLWLPVPSARPWIVAESLGAIAIAAWLLRRLQRELPQPERRLVRFFVVAALLALLPTVATFPMARLVAPASISGAALIALFVRSLWKGGTRWFAWVLLVTHLALPVVFWWGSTTIAATISRNGTAAARTMEVEREWKSLRVIALNAPDPAAFLYLPLERAVELRTLPRSWWVLTQVPWDLELTRTSERAFELRVTNGRLVEGVYEQVVRTLDVPFAVGQRVALDGATVEVLELEGPYPTRLRFELDEPLDAPDVRVLRWHDGTLRRLPLPPLGEPVAIPWEPGPMPR